MPEVAEKPGWLKPYLAHGVSLSLRPGSDHAEGDCPFCGKTGGKFRVNASTGQWDCKVCRAGTERGGGNAYTFLRLLWEESRGQASGEALEALRTERRLVGAATLEAWGVVRSVLTGEWMVPGFGEDGRVAQLYRYRRGPAGKMVLAATPQVPVCLMGPVSSDRLAGLQGTVYLCEGPWDGMALWEVLRLAGRAESVLAVPGCGSFSDRWVSRLVGKSVVLAYDSDHPREHPPGSSRFHRAGYDGMRRAAMMLKGQAKEVRYLRWGPDGYDLSLPSGYDVRDYLSAGETSRERVGRLRGLLGMVAVVPEEWAKDDPKILDCLECNRWEVLTDAWRKALRWTEGLDRALGVMLASVASTRAVGDQLWVKIMGPASCGKSVLCEALSTNPKYVLAKSTIRGFHSGYLSDKEGTQDHSLIGQLAGKTLITKDGDTLLQSPNIGQILSEARDLYDSTSRAHYRHGKGRDYAGVRMTWILCGTGSLRQLDSSELGERFLDCVIMEKIDDDLEDEILWRVANRVDRNLALEADGKLETQHDPDLVLAMRLTGGYVTYLRENARSLLESVYAPEDVLRRFAVFGKFVAYLRARPSARQDETAEREFAARLVSQIVRLGKCLAVVFNRETIDPGVVAAVRAVVLDTARGRAMEIARCLRTGGRDGLEVATVLARTGGTEEKERELLRFMARIGAVEWYRPKSGMLRGTPRWRLTERMERIYDAVMEVRVEGSTDGEAEEKG